MRPTNFLFWNLNKKNLIVELVNICKFKEIDILVLAEVDINFQQLLTELNKDKSEYHYNNPISQCEKVVIITRFNHSYIKPIFETNRITVRLLTLPLASTILLVGVHLIDKMSYSELSQREEASIIISEINKLEIEYEIDKSVILGDFNMNPFEEGMIKATGFHATMSMNVARSISRTVQGNDYKYFFNPMWGLFGDLTKRSAGSFYYQKADHLNYKWNVFDQVLIRPHLLDSFIKESLEILESDGINNFLTENCLPNKELYSDHLPVFFTLNL